jgi:hypothetical protein
MNKVITNKKITRYLPLTFIFFFAFNVVDYFFLRKKDSFNSLASGVEAILIIILCLIYFYEQLRDNSTLLIYTTHNFWIIIGFLIFFAGTFFLYIYTENTLEHDGNAFSFQYGIINSVFNILKNILFAIAMFMKPPPKSPLDFPGEESLISDWNSIRPIKNVN